MDWNDIANNPKTKTVLAHWQKLGTFRNQHIAIGAGQHQMLSASPYTFKRTYNKNGINDKVVVGLGLPQGKKKLTVNGVFEEGEILKDHYSGMKAKVINGTVEINSSFDIVLLEAVSSK
jgi:alpha-amylase